MLTGRRWFKFQFALLRLKQLVLQSALLPNTVFGACWQGHHPEPLNVLMLAHWRRAYAIAKNHAALARGQWAEGVGMCVAAGQHVAEAQQEAGPRGARLRQSGLLWASRCRPELHGSGLLQRFCPLLAQTVHSCPFSLACMVSTV